MVLGAMICPCQLVHLGCQGLDLTPHGAADLILLHARSGSAWLDYYAHTRLPASRSPIYVQCQAGKGGG